MKSLVVALTVLLFSGELAKGQGLLRTLDAFREDLGGATPFFPTIEKKRIVYACKGERHRLLNRHEVRYAFLKAALEREMPCVAIIVEIAPGEGDGKESVIQKFQKHARKIWGASVVELGGFGIPGKTTREYGVKGSKVTFFRIIEQDLKHPDHPNRPARTRITLEAVNYDRSQLNKARLR